jgi:hypothetical protein
MSALQHFSELSLQIRLKNIELSRCPEKAYS